MSEIVKITHTSGRPAKKSAASELKESIISFAIVMILYYLIIGIWRIFTAPFRAIFETERSKIDRAVKIAKEKLAKREWLLLDRGTAYIDDNSNSIMNPIEIGEDELDTDLMCIPNVYLRDRIGNAHFNEAFLNYFENQVALHLKCPWGRRHKFLLTIRNLYPEFTPKFSVLPSEIKVMRDDAKEGCLVNDLYQAVQKMGLNSLTTECLIKNYGNDPDQFKKQLQWEIEHA
jgi:hypothetical protein